jgi:hypothetical protein
MVTKFIPKVFFHGDNSKQHGGQIIGNIANQGVHLKVSTAKDSVDRVVVNNPQYVKESSSSNA